MPENGALMDRRKTKSDDDALRKFRSEFYKDIESKKISLVDAVRGMRKMSGMTQPAFAKIQRYQRENH